MPFLYRTCLRLGNRSGLAVMPNVDDAAAGSAPSNPDSIFQMASNATSEDRAEVRRTITMVRASLLTVECRDHAIRGPSWAGAGNRAAASSEPLSGPVDSSLSALASDPNSPFHSAMLGFSSVPRWISSRRWPVPPVERSCQCRLLAIARHGTYTPRTHGGGRWVSGLDRNVS